MDEKINGWKDGQKYSWMMERKIDGWNRKSMDGLMDGWMDEWKGQFMDG